MVINHEENSQKKDQKKQKSDLQDILLDHSLFIVWQPEYNLGIPIVDEQHKGIITIINSLYFGIQNNYGENMLAPIIDMMYNYTHVHFRIEETFFEKIAFANAENHKELHRQLLSRLSTTGRQSLLNKDPLHFMGFLKKWFIDHICHEDLIYRNYLIS